MKLTIVLVHPENTIISCVYMCSKEQWQQMVTKTLQITWKIFLLIFILGWEVSLSFLAYWRTITWLFPCLLHIFLSFGASSTFGVLEVFQLISSCISYFIEWDLEYLRGHQEMEKQPVFSHVKCKLGKENILSSSGFLSFFSSLCLQKGRFTSQNCTALESLSIVINSTYLSKCRLKEIPSSHPTPQSLLWRWTRSLMQEKTRIPEGQVDFKRRA